MCLLAHQSTLLTAVGNHDGDVAGALADPGGTSSGPGPETLDGHALVGIGLYHANLARQRLEVLAELELRVHVGDRRAETLEMGSAALRLENRSVTSASATAMPRTCPASPALVRGLADMAGAGDCSHL